MPMGRASSCKTFETFSSAINWIGITKLGIPHLIHILDDFLFDLCQKELNLFLSFCEFVGIPIATEKTVGYEVWNGTIMQLDDTRLVGSGTSRWIG